MPSGAMPLRHVERLERKQYEWAMANLELAIFNAKKAGLKLKEIAYEIGVGPATLLRWRKGLLEPDSLAVRRALFRFVARWVPLPDYLRRHDHDHGRA